VFEGRKHTLLKSMERCPDFANQEGNIERVIKQKHFEVRRVVGVEVSKAKNEELSVSRIIKELKASKAANAAKKKRVHYKLRAFTRLS